MSWLSKSIENVSKAFEWIRSRIGHAKHENTPAGPVDRYVKWLEKHNVPTVETGYLMAERYAKQMGTQVLDYEVIHLGPSSLEKSKPKIAPFLKRLQDQKVKPKAGGLPVKVK